MIKKSVFTFISFQLLTACIIELVHTSPILFCNEIKSNTIIQTHCLIIVKYLMRLTRKNGFSQN
jgi:hypothetical protein